MSPRAGVPSYGTMKTGRLGVEKPNLQSVFRRAGAGVGPGPAARALAVDPRTRRKVNRRLDFSSLRRGDDAELRQHAELIEDVPALDDPAVGDANAAHPEE